MKENISNTKYRIVMQTISTFRTPKALISTDQDYRCCPYCSEKLEQYNTLLPIGKEMLERIPGNWCRKCDKLYVRDGKYIRQKLIDNTYAKGFTLNGKALWDYTNEKQRRAIERQERKKQNQIQEMRLAKLAESTSSEVMICIQFEDNTNKEYIIVSKRTDCTNAETLHYTSESGRELLSAAYAEQREGKGILNGKKYEVVDRIYPSIETDTLSDYVFLTKIRIRPDGGYASSIKSKRYELVDTLLYSLKTNQYEIIRSTHDRFTGECFVDISLYRAYIKKYGRPDRAPDFGYWPTIGVRSSDELNSESKLKGYGYSVSKEKGLSTNKRHELLSEVVDLEILTVKQVVNLLEFFIQTHSNDVYIPARAKWSFDLRFIQQYQVNPERFLISRF